MFDFNLKTPKEVQDVINTLYQNKHRARFFYGDADTGKAWMGENDVCGTIGKSTGIKPIPLLINNTRSNGGVAILTHCIVKIVDIDTAKQRSPYNKGVLYQHPQFNNPADRAFLQMPSDIETYVANVLIDNEVHARFRSSQSAQNYIDFMQGKRFSK